MICDALENLNRYRGLHKNLEPPSTTSPPTM